MSPDKVSTLLLFGATGDLAHRMLLPSLYGLHADGLLPDYRVAAVGAEAHRPRASGRGCGTFEHRLRCAPHVLALRQFHFDTGDLLAEARDVGLELIYRERGKRARLRVAALRCRVFFIEHSFLPRAPWD